MLIEHIGAIASLAFYSADFAHGSVKDLCHSNSSFIAMFGVSGSSKLRCTGRSLLKCLPQGTLYLKSLFSESCEVQTMSAPEELMLLKSSSSLPGLILAIVREAG